MARRGSLEVQGTLGTRKPTSILSHLLNKIKAVLTIVIEN